MKVKSDLSVFGTYYLGLIIGGVGCLLGLTMVFFVKVEGIRIVGFLIVIASFFIGKYFVFKSRRRRGHIQYYGGRI